MSDPIQLTGLQGVQDPGVASPDRVLPPAKSDGSNAPSKPFADFIFERLDEVNQLQAEADAGVQRLLTGESDNVAEVFAASNKAGIAFDLLMEVRNKLIEAYREIQQMRV